MLTLLTIISSAAFIRSIWEVRHSPKKLLSQAGEANGRFHLLIAPFFACIGFLATGSIGDLLGHPISSSNLHIIYSLAVAAVIGLWIACISSLAEITRIHIRSREMQAALGLQDRIFQSLKSNKNVEDVIRISKGITPIDNEYVTLLDALPASDMERTQRYAWEQLQLLKTPGVT